MPIIRYMHILHNPFLTMIKFLMPFQKTSNAFLLKAILFLSFAALISGASAATFTWTGGQGGNNGQWNQAKNWGTAPTSGTTNDYIFAGTTAVNTTNNLTTLGATNIIFTNNAGVFTLGGNSLTLSGGVTNLSTNNQTIALQLILVANGVTFNTASNDLTISGNITDGTNTYAVSYTHLTLPTILRV